MKVIVMDESRKRNAQIANLLQRRKHQVTLCTGTNDFLGALGTVKVDRVLLNIDTWQRGNSVYKYFATANKLSSTPIVFYNAPENFSNLSARERNEEDRVLTKPVEAEAVVEALE